MAGICFFMGHHDTPESVMPDIMKGVKCAAQEYGISVFIVGNYGEFDRMAAEAVQNLRKEYPGISLLQLRPYSITQGLIRVPKGFDGIYHPPGMEKGSKYSAIVRANLFMVNHADHVIAYVNHQEGNAARFLREADSRRAAGILTVDNLAEQNE